MSYNGNIKKLEKPGYSFIHQKVWVLVIDTDSYAGNFERPLAAYMTGQPAATEYAHRYAYVAQGQDPAFCDRMEKIIHTFFDDEEHGSDYVAITEGTRESMGGVAIAFSEQPTDEEVTILWQRAQSFLTEDFPEDWCTNGPGKLYGYYLVAHESRNVCHIVHSVL